MTEESGDQTVAWRRFARTFALLALAACNERSCTTESTREGDVLPSRGGRRLDQSLETGVHEIVVALQPDSAEATTLRAIAGATRENLEDQLMELLGLPSDDASRVAAQRASEMGVERWRSGVRLLVHLLGMHGVMLTPEHVATLLLQEIQEPARHD